jgi:glycosyltransferase involved in cell wall biosynthesis
MATFEREKSDKLSQAKANLDRFKNRLQQVKAGVNSSKLASAATDITINDEPLNRESSLHPINKLSGKKILFYYEQLGNTTEVFAGTSTVVIALTTGLVTQENILVDVTGADVNYPEIYQGVNFVPLPKSENLENFLSDYDIVVFATYLKIFSECQKRSNQIWILHIHNWQLATNEINHIDKFDLFICVSDIHRQAISSQGVPVEKISVVPNFTDCQVFAPKPKVNRKPHSIMFAGAIVDHKGLHILFAALPEIRSNFPDTELHIYGSASLWKDRTDEYEKELRSKQLSGVYFHGAVPNSEMPEIYPQHGIIAVPSQEESFGMVAVEGQACGCIPVVHNAGGVAATLVEGETGFLYWPNTPEELAKTIIRVFKIIDDDVSIRERAINFVRDKLEKTVVLTRYIDVLKDVVSQSNREIFSQPITHKMITNDIALIDKILCQIKNLPENFQPAGALPPTVLEAIANYAKDHSISNSVETGCGVSTILLSNISKIKHKCFALPRGDLDTVKSSPLLNKDTIEFVEGPTQRNLPYHNFSEKLQLALIDGAHGYPFPEIDYYFIYPHLDEGALLIIDDIWIPTIQNLYLFLKEDEMFELLEVIGNRTAFFRRTSAVLLDPYGDGWWVQNYNKQRFPLGDFEPQFKENIREALWPTADTRDSHFEQIRDPKKKEWVSACNADLISSSLRQLGIEVVDYIVDIDEYKQFFQDAGYIKNFPQYNFSLPEKSLEHYLAVEFLKFNSSDIYIEVGSEADVASKIYPHLYGVSSYVHSSAYPSGINQNMIGGTVTNLPLPDGFATKMAVHTFCSLEEDADMGFIKEAARLLKPGGRVCILPLYLFDEYAVQTDPVTAISTGGVKFEEDAIVYCSLGWGHRHARFYDPQHLFDRIYRNLIGLKLKIYRIKNAKQVDDSCYIQFAAVLEKPLDDDTFALDPQTAKISSFVSLSKQKLALYKQKNTLGKPKPHLNLSSSMSSQPRIDVVLQATGTHGWNFSRGWANVLQRQGLLNRVFTPVAEWGHSEPTNDDGLYEYLRNPQADIMLLLGFDWHSQSLHNSPRWQNQWNQARIKKVVTVPDSYFNDAVQNTPGWREQMSMAIQSTLPCVDGIICHHEPDVKYLREQEHIAKPIIFSPFAVDRQYFHKKISFQDRLDRAFFRGQVTNYHENSPYKDRDKLIEYLSKCQSVDVHKLDISCLVRPVEAVQSYSETLNKYKILLSLPSLSPTLVSRTFESLACGGLVLQSQIIGDKSNQLFREWEHLVYYNPENPDNLIEKIEYLLKNPDLAEEIAERGYQLCQEKHTIECRVKELVEWVNNDFILSENSFNSAIQDASENQVNTYYKIQKSIEEVNLNESLVKPPVIVIDAVFFQLNNTGIARVWQSLLEEWAWNSFKAHLVILDRAYTAPRINVYRYLDIPAYDYHTTEADRQMLQEICDREGADIFISSYYTTPISTPSVFMGYDMIPEVIGKELDHPMWKEKRYAINHASAYITISENTAKDLVKNYPEQTAGKPINVAYCGFRQLSPSSIEDIGGFRGRYGISKPYFLLVGDRVGWHGYKNCILFFHAFYQLANKSEFDIVCVGGNHSLEEEFYQFTVGVNVYILRLSDEDLKLAYSGALVLVYPSQYEGFGMPVLEAMACGCPVITCPKASIPEVGGNAVLYVNETDVDGMVKALQKVQEEKFRHTLIKKGLEQCQKFSWAQMSRIIAMALNTATQLYYDLAKNEVQKINQSLSNNYPKNKILIVTSIAPGNVEEQKLAMSSWQALGFSVVSLNSLEEINQLQPIYSNITFHPVVRHAQAETGKPLVYLNDILSYLSKSGTKICGIVNSDIHLRANPDLVDYLAREAINSMIFGSRIDVWSLNYKEEGVEYDSGFDYLFFDSDILKYYPLDNFCLGMPWWDYWIIVALIKHEVKLKKLSAKIAYHHFRQIRYSQKNWLKYGLEIAKYYLDISDYKSINLENLSENEDVYQTALQLCHNLGEYILAQIRSREEKIIYEGLNSIIQIEEVTNKVFPQTDLFINTSPTQFKVSAIVSTYNSEKFIYGRIENLVNQTLYQRGELEIIVIDSNSQQNEEFVLQQFQKKYQNIVYVKTEERETIYQAWNRGFVRSKGRYVITANADDRFALNALEILANELDDNSKLNGVYGDWLVTQVENDLFESNTNKFLFEYPEFFPPLFLYYQITSHAVLLRRDVFDQIGYYDGNMKVFGDREFMLRFASSGFIAKRIPHVVGLYYENPNSLSMGEVGYTALANEYEPLRQLYLQPEILSKLFGYNYIPDNFNLSQLYAVVGSWGNEFYIWDSQPVSDIPFAEKVFSKALELDRTNSLALNNLAIIRATQGNYQQATEILNLALRQNSSDQPTIKANMEAVKNHCSALADYFWLKPPLLKFMSTTQSANYLALEASLVSVIIPTKDRPEMLELAVQSVLAQTYKNLEIIVVNDGGVDVQKRIDKLNTRGNITYLKHPDNQGRSAARNTGIHVAKGKYIAFLDDDDTYYPYHIQTLVEFLENSDYQIAYTDAVMAEQERRDDKYITVNSSVPYSLDFDYDKILVSNYIPNLCLMYEKSCLDAVGLFDTSLHTHEDWDLIIKLSRRYRLAHIAKTTCEFTWREDGTTTTSRNRGDFSRTIKIIYDRYKHYAQYQPAILEGQQGFISSQIKELAF